MQKNMSKNKTHSDNFASQWKQNKVLFLMLAPVVLFYTIFAYYPMYGAIIAFKNYRPSVGILGSKWIGIKNFADFFTDPFFGRLMKNTLSISVSNIAAIFILSITFALMMNEVKCIPYKKAVQTISYFPHFISIVVVCSLIKDFVSDTGIITNLLMKIGICDKPVSLLMNGKFFLPIYVISDIWKELGWESIIYMAALSGINAELYEAAMVDGAGRWKQTIHITIPSILPTIIIMLILKVGSVLSLGYEKIILLYNPLIYDNSDVISTYVYRQGIQNFNWSYSTAVGLFNSAVNFLLVWTTNRISKKFTETSLW